MKIALVLKGNINTRHRFSLELVELQAAFPAARITVFESGFAGQAVELAAAACSHCDYLVAAGGDGTLNEVFNGCMQALDANPGLELPVLGVLAHGSANDFIRSIGLDGTAAELCSLLASGSVRRVDAGRLSFQDASGMNRQRYFLNVADVGIGASVVERLGSSGGYLGSNLNYLRAILSTFIRYRHMELRVESDAGLDWQGRTLALVAANGCYFGSGLCVAPGARPDDGELFLTLVGDASIVDFLGNLGRLKRGIPLDHPAVQYHQASSVRITSPGRPVAVEADGEFLGYTPAVIEILPLALSLLAP